MPGLCRVFHVTVLEHSVIWLCFCEAYYIHIMFPGVSLTRCSGSPCSRLPGGRGDGLGSSDGKVGQRSQPSTGELLKRPGEMMSWTLSSPPYVFPSLLQQWRSPAAGAEPSFGQTRHAHQRNTRHWWLHWAEIRLPSIRSKKGLLWKIGFPRLGVILPCCNHCVYLNQVRFQLLECW